MTKDNSKTSGREITLSDGRVLSVNLKGVSWNEVMAAVPLTRFDAGNIAFLARSVGISPEEFGALEYGDAYQIEQAVWAFVRNPLAADPN